MDEPAHVGGILLHELVPDGNLVGGFTVGPKVRAGSESVGWGGWDILVIFRYLGGPCAKSEH